MPRPSAPLIHPTNEGLFVGTPLTHERWIVRGAPDALCSIHLGLCSDPENSDDSIVGSIGYGMRGASWVACAAAAEASERLVYPAM